MPEERNIRLTNHEWKYFPVREAVFPKGSKPITTGPSQTFRISGRNRIVGSHRYVLYRQQDSKYARSRDDEATARETTKIQPKTHE